MRRSSSARVVIDRIEGDLAVLVLYRDDRVKFNFPKTLLPQGAREGDHLMLTLKLDESSREEERKKIEELLRELTQKDSA
jgi:hypothetical protein